jgi:hypothetical protein
MVAGSLASSLRCGRERRPDRTISYVRGGDQQTAQVQVTDRPSYSNVRTELLPGGEAADQVRDA